MTRSLGGACALLSFLSLIAISPFSLAQSEPKPNVQYPSQLIDDLTRLRDAAMSSDYAYRQLAHLTENIGARPGGSPQAEHAVAYVADELRRLGLEVKLEEVRVPRWTRGIESAELVQYPGQAPGTRQRIVLTTLSGSSATSTDGITAEVVVVHSFDELNSLGAAKVKGRIVLFDVVFDRAKAAAGYADQAYGDAVQYRSKGARAAAELGAVAALVRSVGGAEYRIPHTGYSQQGGIPAAAITAEDAILISHLVSEGTVRLHLTLTPHVGPEVVSHNVIADLKGSEHPEQIVVLSGHLDSWDLGQGAIDDGAGVAVAMQAAQLIQQLHLQPKRTLRVIAWMDEENGGRGHDAYEKAHTAEFSNYIGVVESDMGAGHPLGFNCKIIPEAVPILQPMLDVMKATGATVLKLSNTSPGSDIEPMVRAGVPGFAPLTDDRTYFDYHHTPADTLDKIVPRELQENAAAMVVLGYTLTNLPQPLPR
jgi:carboxypeptidase Q